jgi:hypothetical protein
VPPTGPPPLRLWTISAYAKRWYVTSVWGAAAHWYVALLNSNIRCSHAWSCPIKAALLKTPTVDTAGRSWSHPSPFFTTTEAGLRFTRLRKVVPISRGNWGREIGTLLSKWRADHSLHCMQAVASTHVCYRGNALSGNPPTIAPCRRAPLECPPTNDW